MMELDRSLDRLLYVVTHDLREPARSIRSFAELLDETVGESLDREARDLLDRIAAGADRLEGRLRDVADVARARRVEPMAVSSLEDPVREALAELSGPLRDTDARIAVGDGWPAVRVDPACAARAVRELVENAVKFHQPGVSPWLDIVPWSGEQSGVAIGDRGPGVPPEHRERIFDLFQRAAGREVAGRGVGLAIVRAVAEGHGGRAWMRPRNGGGSEFILTFGSGGEAR